MATTSQQDTVILSKLSVDLSLQTDDRLVELCLLHRSATYVYPEFVNALSVEITRRFTDTELIANDLMFSVLQNFSNQFASVITFFIQKMNEMASEVNRDIWFVDNRQMMINCSNNENAMEWLILPENNDVLTKVLNNQYGLNIIGDSLIASTIILSDNNASSTWKNVPFLWDAGFWADRYNGMDVVHKSAELTNFYISSPDGLQAVVNSSVAMSTMVNKPVIMQLIINNSTSLAAVVASDVAMTAVAASITAMTAMAASSVAMAEIAANSTSLAAVIASSVAMTEIVASSTAMTAVAASSKAMTAVIASSTAMAAVASSSIAMTAVDANDQAVRIWMLAGTNQVFSNFVNVVAVTDSVTAMTAIISSNIAMTAVAASSTALAKIVVSPTARSILIGNNTSFQSVRLQIYNTVKAKWTKKSGTTAAQYADTAMGNINTAVANPNGFVFASLGYRPPYTTAKSECKHPTNAIAASMGTSSHPSSLANLDVVSFNGATFTARINYAQAYAELWIPPVA